MNIRLKDGAPRATAETDVNISKNGNTLEISASAAQAESPQVVLEFYRGKLTFRLYGQNGQPSVEQEIPYDLATNPARRAAPAQPDTGSAMPASVPGATPESAAPEDDEVAAFDAA